MKILFHQRVVYRQAMMTLIIAFLLGFIMSAIQIGTDLVKVKKHIDSTILQIINMHRESATQAIFLLDKNSAKAVVKGLFEYHSIRQAKITDEFGTVLAFKEQPPAAGSLKWLANLIFGPGKTYTIPLLQRNYKKVGYMIVSIDNYLISEDFFNRLKIIIISDFIRVVILASTLMFIFHYLITGPLLNIVEHVSSVDPVNPAKKTAPFSEKTRT